MANEKISKVTAEMVVVLSEIAIDNFFEYFKTTGLYQLLLDDRVKCVLNKLINKINPVIWR